MPEKKESKYKGEERRRPPMNGEAREAWKDEEDMTAEEKREAFRRDYERFKFYDHYHRTKPGMKLEEEKEEKKEEKKPEKKPERKRSWLFTPI